MAPRIQELLDYSYKHNLAHIPSALSMYNYIEAVFKWVIKKDDIIILGKPFGAQAYYLIWKRLGWLDDIDNLAMGVKHDQIPFVDYSEETIGNALGVAIGMALAEPNKQVYVNISDATLQMGNALEAIQFIGQNQVQNILVTVDMNNSQVTGTTSEIIDVNPVINLCKEYGWQVYDTDGTNHRRVHTNMAKYRELNVPTIMFFRTKKGQGVSYMEKNPQEWHYKKLTEEHMI